MDALRGRIPVKAERDAVRKDDDSDSDSAVERTRVYEWRQRRAEQTRKEAQRARAEQASRVAPGAAAHAAAAPRRAAPPAQVKTDQQRQLYRSNLEQHHPGASHGAVPVNGAAPERIVQITDFLTQGTLTVDLLARINDMYKPEFFDRNMTVRNPKLYEVDTEERARAVQRGMFNDPGLFTVVREMLSRHKAAQRDAATVRGEAVNLCDIEVVTRRYAAQFLREPDSTENACVNGNNCLSKQWFDFVLVEFLPPAVKAAINSKGERSSARYACLLCQRRGVTYTHAIQLLASLPNPDNYVRQCHRNLQDREGEYPSEFCQDTDVNTPYPVVMNSRFRYQPQTVDGRRWLVETYRKCTKEDEHRPVFCTGTPRPRTAASSMAGAAQPPPMQ